MDLTPIDPNSDVAKEILAVHAATQGGKSSGQLVPVDPKSQVGQEVLTLATKQAGANLESTKPQRGTDLTPTPIQPGTAPRPMGGVTGLNEAALRQGKVETVAPNKAGALSSYGPAAAQFALGMTPIGRTGQMILGGGLGAMEPAESLGERATNAAIGAVTPLIGEVGGKIVKSGLRTVSKFMSPAAMRTAGSAIQEGVKEIATPVAPTATREALDAVGKSLRTPRAAMDALSEHVDKFVSSYKAGKPFSYGDFFEHANQIGQKAHQFFESSSGQASGRALKTVQDAMMKDLAAIGPEAAKATEAWKNAVGGIGGWGSAKKIWTALGASSIPGVGALVAPVAGAAGGAGAVVSALAGLGVRAPGVGQSLAKSLISPDGTVVKAALPALAQLIKDANKEY